MSFPSPITALKLRVSAGTAPNAQSFEQPIPSATMGSNSMQIMPNTTLFNAFNSHPFGTSFTSSVVTSYGSDQSGNGLSVVSTPSILPNFVPRQIIPPNLSLESIQNKLTTDSSFYLSDFITTDSDGVLSYSSSNTSVASVRSNEVVLFGTGTTTINVSQAASANGQYTADSVSTQLIVSAPLIIRAANNLTIQYVGPALTSIPRFIQANPRRRGPEWFAVVTNASKAQITAYAKSTDSAVSAYFTPP